MKSGFILVELLISTTIAAVMSVLLLGALYQTNKVQIAMDGVIDTTARASLLQYYMERDIMGAFVPVMDVVEQEKAGEAGVQQQPANVQVPPAQTSEKKVEKRSLEKSFYGVSKDGRFELLTMITSNPLITYWDTKTGSPKARIARVTYTLEPSKENKDSYIMYRAETQDLVWQDAQKTDEKKQARKYELVRGVKELKIEYEFAQQKKEQTATAGEKKEEKKEAPTYTLMPEWRGESEDGAKKTEDKKSNVPPIPEYVHISVRFWTPQGKESAQFKTIAKIMVLNPGDVGKEKKEEKLTKENTLQKPTSVQPAAVSKRVGRS
jgi:hypothetical protein